MKSKVLFRLFAACVFTLCCAFSCSDEVLSGETNNSGGGENSEPIKPGASKEFLQETALEFMDVISAQDYENLAEFAEFVESEFNDFDIDEDFVDIVEDLYDEESNYYYDAPFRNPVQVMLGFSKIALESAQSTNNIATKSGEVYSYFLSLDASLSDFYGKFEPNYKDEIFEFDNSVNDRIELSIKDDKNQKWVATLKGSKATSLISVKYKLREDYTYESYYDDYNYSSEDSEEYDFKISVPEKIDFQLTCNGDVIVSWSIDSKIPFEADINEDCITYDSYYDYNHDHSYEVSLDYSKLELNTTLNVNDYIETFTSSVDDKHIIFASSVVIKGQQMLEANMIVDGNLDEIKNDLDNILEDYNEDEEIDLSDIKKVEASLNVMDKVQIKASCNSLKGLVSAMENIDDSDYGYDDKDFERYSRYVDELNEKFDAKVYYNNNNTLQAVLQLEAEKDWHNEWDDEYYYDMIPIILFAADESKYSVDDFFDDNLFNKVENEFEDLIESFEDMFDF